MSLIKRPFEMLPAFTIHDAAYLFLNLSPAEEWETNFLERIPNKDAADMYELLQFQLLNLIKREKVDENQVVRKHTQIIKATRSALMSVAEELGTKPFFLYSELHEMESSESEGGQNTKAEQSSRKNTTYLRMLKGFLLHAGIDMNDGKFAKGNATQVGKILSEVGEDFDFKTIKRTLEEIDNL